MRFRNASVPGGRADDSPQLGRPIVLLRPYVPENARPVLSGPGQRLRKSRLARARRSS
jgi:hypothetical protein